MQARRSPLSNFLFLFFFPSFYPPFVEQCIALTGYALFVHTRARDHVAGSRLLPSGKVERQRDFLDDRASDRDLLLFPTSRCSVTKVTSLETSTAIPLSPPPSLLPSRCFVSLFRPFSPTCLSHFLSRTLSSAAISSFVQDI